MTTQDEIIEMAKQSGLTSIDKKSPYLRDCLERFAKLVAAKEREACAKVCESLNLYGSSESRQLQRATLKDCAYAIRARSQPQRGQGPRLPAESPKRLVG